MAETDRYFGVKQHGSSYNIADYWQTVALCHHIVKQINTCRNEGKDNDDEEELMKKRKTKQSHKKFERYINGGKSKQCGNPNINCLTNGKPIQSNILVCACVWFSQHRCFICVLEAVDHFTALFVIDENLWLESRRIPTTTSMKKNCCG